MSRIYNLYRKCESVIDIDIFVIQHSIRRFQIRQRLASMQRRLWTLEEDQTISRLVKQYGNKKWTVIAEKLNENYACFIRSGKQCRQRWHNHLDPSINKETWTEEEENTLFRAHQKYGNRWKQISKLFQGRTDNSIKNHFYSTLRRSLRRLNKYLGSKNSTSRMRQVKPSVLSQILEYVGNETDDFSNENQKIASQNVKNLPWLIFSFSQFKPAKNRNGLSLQKEQITLVEDIMNKINQFNQLYEQQRSARKQNRQKLLKKVSRKYLQNCYKLKKQQLILSQKTRQSIQQKKEKVYDILMDEDEDKNKDSMFNEGEEQEYIRSQGSLLSQKERDNQMDRYQSQEYIVQNYEQIDEMQLMRQVNPPSNFSQNIDGLCFMDNLIVYGTQLKISNLDNQYDIGPTLINNQKSVINHKQSEEYIQQILEMNYDSLDPESKSRKSVPLFEK